MANKKCKDKKKKDTEPKQKKYTCKKCGLTSNKEKRLCKPIDKKKDELR